MIIVIAVTVYLLLGVGAVECVSRETGEINILRNSIILNWAFYVHTIKRIQKEIPDEDQIIILFSESFSDQGIQAVKEARYFVINTLNNLREE